MNIQSDNIEKSGSPVREEHSWFATRGSVAIFFELAACPADRMINVEPVAINTIGGIV